MLQCFHGIHQVPLLSIKSTCIYSPPPHPHNWIPKPLSPHHLTIQPPEANLVGWHLAESLL